MSKGKGFTRKLFAGGLAMVMSISLWATVAQANNVGIITDVDNANHWGRSDLRAYLNNGLGIVTTDGTVTDKNYRLDSTSNSDNESGYAAHFTDGEYALIQPWTYTTNILSSDGTIISTYETTDKFVLPSANYTHDKILSWGSDDISASTTYTTANANDKARMIPLPYWAYGKSSASPVWLRSSATQSSANSMESYRGHYASHSSVTTDRSIAPLFKVDAGNIHFASIISAKKLAKDGESQRMDIMGASIWGQKSTNALPDYGMYLKTISEASFQATRVDYDASTSTITVDFNDGIAGKYVVGQVYKQDDLELGTTCYGFVKLIPSDAATEILVDVSNWHLTSLDGYTIKIWMEDATTINLASATTPNTFYGESGLIGKVGTESTNLRVFAMKNQLQTSWGDLASLESNKYNEVLSGNATSLIGSNSTNQKIYYGIDDSGNPLQFWIAGRENAAGEISADGNILCLYQSKATESRSFNATTEDYLPAPTAKDFNITLPMSLTYDGSQKEVTVSPKDSITGVGAVTVKYYDTTGQQLENAPIYPGTYQVKLDVTEGTSYTSVTDLTSKSWTFTIEPRALEVRSVTVSDKYYDGNTSATVEAVTFDSLSGSDYLMCNTDYEVGATFENASSGTDKTVTVTITLKNTDLTRCYTFMKDGKKMNTITFHTTADILIHSDWGSLVEKKGVIQYIDVDGTTSAEISDNDIIWLLEECDGVSTWYGIDNSDGIFETGSRFYIREISPTDTDYNNLSAMVDESNSAIIQDDNGKLLQAGVKDSDGEEYIFSNKTKLYVQRDESWRTGGEVLFIMEGVDESLVESETQMSAPDGHISCVEFHITHNGFIVLCDAYCNGTNHTYETAPVFTWAQDYSSCTITLACANNRKHVNTYDCEVTSIVKNEATYKDVGVTEYTATYGEYKDVKEVTDIPATGIPARGKVIGDETTSATYKVTKSGVTGGTVQYVAPKDKKASTVTVPASIAVDGITYKVTSIAKDAFKGNRYITTIKMGTNITSIGANAFYNCKKLKSVTIGSNVTTIGDKAFYKCVALTKITIPSKVKKIGKSAFYGCKKLKAVTIKTSKLTTKNVGKNAFKGVGSKYYKKVVVKVPKKKLKTYKTMLKKRGLSTKSTVKKY